MNRNAMRWSVVLLLGLICLACHHSGADKAQAAVDTPASKTISSTTNPATMASSTQFASAKYHIGFDLPAGWTNRESKDYVLLQTPDAKLDPKTASVSLDVPELPVHIPGMIPISSVRNGYVDDLRKQQPSLKVQNLSPPKIAEAQTLLVRCDWTAKDGHHDCETALLMVHADHVYIVRATSDADHETQTHEAFDRIVRSIHWIK